MFNFLHSYHQEEVTQARYDQIKSIIDSFNIEELRNLLKSEGSEIHYNIDLSKYLSEVIEQQLGKIVAELQTNPKYDCSQLLVFLSENTPFLPQKYAFRGSENLIKILEYTEDLEIYDLAFSTLQKCSTAMISNSYEIFPRILYLGKIFYHHINFLSSRKINLIDYYYEDPKYRELCHDPIDSLQFDIEYYEPTQLDESYEDLQKNFGHKKRLQGQKSIKKIQIIDDNSTSALTLTRNLLNMQNQHFSPLIEIVKYRILIKRGFQTDPQKTRNIIIGLHLKSLNFMGKYRTLFENKRMKKCFKEIIGEVKYTDNFNLFQLETIDRMPLMQILQIQSNNTGILNNEKYLDYLKQLISDVLSMNHIEQNEQIQGYPLKYNCTMLSQQIAIQGELTSCILKTISIRSINKNQLSSDIIRILRRVLNIQDNRLLLLPEQLEDALVLFNIMSIKDLETLNQNSNDLLFIIGYYINQGQNLYKPTQQGYIQINETEADSIFIKCVKIIVSNFQFMLRLQNNPQRFNQIINIDTLLATKILNTNILNSFAIKLTQQPQLSNTTQSALQFISCLTNADPQLTERIINSKIPSILNEIIQRIRIEEFHFRMAMDILMFYANICRQEYGFQLFSNQVIRLIHDLLYYNLVVQDNTKMLWINQLGQLINEFLYQNDKMQNQVIEILQQIYQQVLEQLNNKIKNLKFDQESKTEFKNIVQKKHAILSFNNKIRLRQNYNTDIIQKFLKIPSFNNLSSSQINLPRIIETVLQLIEQWEAELGCTLEDAQLQYLDEKKFFDQFSPQNLTMATHYSEIFSYLSALNFDTIRTTVQDLKCKLLQKLCPLFQMVIVTKDYEQLKKQQDQFSALDILSQTFSYLIQLNIDKYLEPIGRFFDKLSQYLVSSPNTTLQLLIIINSLLSMVVPVIKSKLQILLINSSFRNNLLDSLKNYNRIDKQNSQMTKNLNDNFIQLLNFLYQYPRSIIAQTSILPKIIQDISSLYQMLIDPYQENLSTIMELLNKQIQEILDPKFLERVQSVNQFINQLQEKGYSKQFILKIFDLYHQISQVIDFVHIAERHQNLVDQQTSLQNQQLDGLDIELIKAQIESLKHYIQSNILRLPTSQLFFQNFKGIQFDKIVLLKYLQQTAYQQFNLKLSFEGVEFKNSDSPPWRIGVILKLLNKHENFAEQQDLIAMEILKILEVLLQQPELCKQGIQAVSFTISILTKLINNNEQIFDLILIGIKKILDSKDQNQIALDLCIDVLIKVFSRKRQTINQFIYDMKGLELLQKLPGSYAEYISIFCRLAVGIIFDKTILRVQIEAKLKRIIFDQENNDQIKKAYENKNSLYYQNEKAYPVCLQPTKYNVQTNNQWKIKKNNPNLLALQNDQLFKEEVKDVMNVLFNEQEEEQCFLLKNGIGLDTLNSINNNGDPISQFNFKHTKETQIFLKFLIQELITSYFEKNRQQQFHWKATLQVLLFVVQKFPILSPLLLRINCSQFLQQYKHQIGYELQELPTNLSFLSLITRFIQPSHNFLLKICLDNIVLFRKSNNIIVPFGNEIRRIIIKQLFSEICKSIKTFDEKLKNLTFILGTLLQIKSVAKICIKNINEPQDSFNFVNVFIEGIKNLDLQQSFIYKDQVFCITTILNLLYNAATWFLLEKNAQQTMRNNYPQRRTKIIGEMQIEEMQNQLFSFDQRLQYPQPNSLKISKLYFLQWPFFTDENYQEQIQDELVNDQLHEIKENQEPQEICAIDLEHEEMQFTDEIGQEAKEQSYNNIENNKVFKDFMDVFFLNYKIELNFQFNEINTQLLLPKQFQHHLIKLQDLLIQDSSELLLTQPNQLTNLIEEDNMNRIIARGMDAPLGFHPVDQFLRNNQTIQGRNITLTNLLLENLQNPSNFRNPRFRNENMATNVDGNPTEIDVNNIQSIEYEADSQLFQSQEFQFHQVQQQAQQQQNNQNRTYQNIENNINSIMKKRINTLKILGKQDNQFIQILLKLICIEDVGDNLNCVSNFLKTIATKLNITNQIINDLIQILKQQTQNLQLENLRIKKKEPVHDCNDPQELVKKRISTLMLDLQKLSKCSLSASNFNELIYLIQLFQGEQLNLLIQFMINQEQLSIIELSQDQIQSLFNCMLKVKDLEISNNYINFISKLWVVQQNRTLFIGCMENGVEETTQYYYRQLQSKNTSDSSFNKINEVEKIFQLLHIAYKQGAEEQNSCEKFLNSLQVENLMKLTEQVISIIPKEQVQKYYPQLVPVFSFLVISNQILNPNNPQQLNILNKLASMEISNSLSGSLEIRNNDFESLSREICRKGKFFINYIIKEKLLLLNRMRNRYQQPTQNLHDFKFQHLYVEYFFQNHSKIIDFENKKLYFHFKIRNRGQINQQTILVRREHIFEDSYRQLLNCNPEQLKRIKIQFERENGIDAGGLSQEWIQTLTQEILDSNNKLFVPTPNTQFFQINRESYQDPDHLNKFKFVGRIFAIAIINRLKIFGRFPISFFKHIVGQKLSIFDISYHDEGLYSQFYSLYYNRGNIEFEQYFLYTIVNNGKPEDLALKQGGGDILVTQENKKEFIKMYCHQIMAKNIENQMKAFQEGFYSIIPRQQISIFDSTQLEQLLCGQSYIDVEDLIKNLQYCNYAPDHQAIIWFQNTLRSFNQDLLAKFLKFITGSPLAPIGGFQNLKHKIEIRKFNYDFNMIDQVLPVGHTCSHQLELPPYSQEQILASKLELAITEGLDEFSLA